MNFDEVAKKWDDQPERRERAAVVAAAIRRLLPPGKRTLTALELGCGTGLLSFALTNSFAKITLTDSSEGMLATLADKIRAAGLTHLVPLKADLADFPSDQIRCDVIYSLLALHHVPDHLTLLTRCHAMLNPGGLLFIADLEKEDGSYHSQIPDFIGHHGFDNVRLQADLADIGYRNITCEKVYELTKPAGRALKVYPLFLLKAEKEEMN